MGRRVLLVVLLLSALFSGLFLYYYKNGSSEKDSKVLVSRDQAIEGLFNFIDSLVKDPQKTIGFIECDDKACNKGDELSTSGGNFWPLYAAASLVVDDSAEPSLKGRANLLMDKYLGKVDSILTAAEGNPFFVLFMLERAFRASQLRGAPEMQFLQPYLQAMPPIIVSTNRVTDRESLVAKTQMVLAQIAREYALFHQFLNDPTAMSQAKHLDVMRGLIEGQESVFREQTEGALAVLSDIGREAITGDVPKYEKPDYCWALQSMAFYWKVRPTEKLLDEVTFSLRKLYEHDGEFWSNNPALHSYLPCLELLTTLDGSYMKEVRVSKVQEILNKMLDSPLRPLCDGDGAILSNTVNWSSQPICNGNSKAISDASWMIDILLRLPKDTVFTLDRHIH